MSANFQAELFDWFIQNHIIVKKKKTHYNSSGNISKRPICKCGEVEYFIPSYHYRQKNFRFSLNKTQVLLQSPPLRISKVYNIWYWDFWHSVIRKYKGFLYYPPRLAKYKEKWNFYDRLINFWKCVPWDTDSIRQWMGW